MKQILRRGFTLVELLIVIALIAILSVAVLATINPVEQANKAKDSTRMNDAGEVLNAAERYYASNMANAQYPWTGFADEIVNDDEVIYTSNQNGFGLCLSAGASADASNIDCAYDPDTATTRGLLVTTTELKDSFLSKGYADDANTFDEQLYLVKRGSDEGNSIFVCFIPKAAANRKSTSDLKVITITDYETYTFEDADPDADFLENGNPDPAVRDFLTLETSMFKCVP